MQIQFLTYYQLYNEGVVRRQQLPHYQKNIAKYLKNELCTQCIKTEIQKKKKSIMKICVILQGTYCKSYTYNNY